MHVKRVLLSGDKNSSILKSKKKVSNYIYHNNISISEPLNGSAIYLSNPNLRYLNVIPAAAFVIIDSNLSILFPVN